MSKQKAYAAFVAAQKEFSPALKTSTNPHFRSKYADLGAVIEAVIDGLHNHGFAVIQRPIPNERGVNVETIFLHDSGEEINGGQFYAPAQKQDPQGYGSAATYCRRYGLMAACGIAPEDDDGNAASKSAKTAPTPSELAMEWIGALDQAQTLDELKTVFGQAWQATRHNKAVQNHYNNLKAKFEGEQA